MVWKIIFFHNFKEAIRYFKKEAIRETISNFLSIEYIYYSLKFQNWPVAPKFGFWKLAFRREVCAKSARPSEAMQWICEVDEATPYHDPTEHSEWLKCKLPMQRAKLTTKYIYYQYIKYNRKSNTSFFYHITTKCYCSYYTPKHLCPFFFLLFFSSILSLFNNKL